MKDGGVAPLLCCLMFAAMVLTLGAWFYLSINFPNPSEEVRRLIETCSYTWKIRFCTLAGAFGIWARAHLAGPY